MAPKPKWTHFPLVPELQKHFPQCKIILETDCNAPAYSEYLATVAKFPNELHAVTYLTVGTGVGLGVFTDGKPYHGCLHPEFGHSLIRKRDGDNFEGVCPFHKDCIEGLISAPALAKRLGIEASELPSVANDNPIWDLFAFYLGETAANVAMAYAADRMYVGGGICTAEGREFIFEKANAYCKEALNGYVEAPLIAPPEYLQDAGLVGASALAFHSEVFLH
jgi:fructokinase